MDDFHSDQKQVSISVIIDTPLPVRTSTNLQDLPIWIIDPDPDPAFQAENQSGSRVLRTSKLQEKLSAFKKEYAALQNMKFLTCVLFLWVIFALLDSDPLTLLNPYLDPKHC
jgi:hypothetical protein